MNKEKWIVGDYAIRPAGSPTACFYCGQEKGTEHQSGCVLRRRTVVVETRIQVVVEVPEDWDEEHISRYYSDYPEVFEAATLLQKNVSTGAVKYVREATSDDEEITELTIEDVRS